MLIRAYRFRPEPTAAQDRQLRQFAMARRFIWNRFYRRAERKLRRAQRVHSRHTTGSRTRNKARLKVARLQQRIVNQRADFAHKLSTTLTKTHEAVCIADLNVRGLARTKPAKSVHDASRGWCAGSWSTRAGGTGRTWWPWTGSTRPHSAVTTADTRTWPSRSLSVPGTVPSVACCMTGHQCGPQHQR